MRHFRRTECMGSFSLSLSLQQKNNAPFHVDEKNISFYEKKKKTQTIEKTN